MTRRGWPLLNIPRCSPRSIRCTSSTRKSCNSIRPLDTPERAQWLELAQFPTEDRAKQFREDFMSLVGTDEIGHITGPAWLR
jgi:hypothetical protein